MAYVPVPKDLSKIKTKLAFNLTKMCIRDRGKGVGYDRWASKHNLKQMAATVTAYQQYGFSSPEELDEAYHSSEAGGRF